VLKNSRRVPPNFAILNAQHDQAKCLHVLVALGIILHLRLVDATVYFEDQSYFMAVEIYDETTDDLLAAKVEIIQLPSP
jgi:hypothetical protein